MPQAPSRRLVDRIPAAPLGAFSALVARAEEVIPSYTNYCDVLCFKSILELQAALSIRGDLLEIGTLRGKTAAIVASCLKEGETLVVADLFDEVVDGKNDFYGQLSALELVRQNIRSVVGEEQFRQVEFIPGLSSELEFAAKRFRFIHVDGGHGYADCYGDLKLSFQYLLPGGVVAVDDYVHPRYPEVAQAVDDFVAQNSDVAVMMDVNRFDSLGRKIYLTWA